MLDSISIDTLYGGIVVIFALILLLLSRCKGHMTDYAFGGDESINIPMHILLILCFLELFIVYEASSTTILHVSVAKVEITLNEDGETCYRIISSDNNIYEIDAKNVEINATDISEINYAEISVLKHKKGNGRWVTSGTTTLYELTSTSTDAQCIQIPSDWSTVYISSVFKRGSRRIKI